MSVSASTLGLDQRQKAEYEERGFLLIEDGLPRELIRRANLAFESLAARCQGQERPECLEWEPGGDPAVRKVRRVYNPVEHDEVFREIAYAPEVLDRVESLIGRDLQLHHSKLNAKEARVGSGADWHQDLAYIPHTNSDLVAVLVHLEEAFADNGCIKLSPGAHKKGLLSHSSGGAFAGLITEPGWRSGLEPPQVCEASAGSLLFVHCLTPHCSAPNSSERSRRLLILQYRAADAYPIYFDEQIKYVEPLSRQVRGRRAPCARFGFPELAIPQMKGHSSLFDLQERHRGAAEP